MPSLPSVDTAFYSALSAGTALTARVGSAIYNLQAPPGVALPYVVYYLASGLIPNVVQRDTLDFVYRVEGLATTRGSAEAIHQQIYAVLHESTLTITGWTNYWTACETITPIFENVSGSPRWRFVGDYRVKASSDT